MAPTLDWDDVRYFLAVVRHGRLAPAARALGVEHTTVGRRLAALEQAVGTALFNRTAAGYLLTRAGQRALGEAEAMERSVRGLAMRTGATPERIEGRVRLALIESFAVTWLAPHLPRLRARHPLIELEVITGQAQTDLSRGEAEIAVRTPRPAQRELAAVRLGSSAFTLFAVPAVAERLPAGGLDRDPPQTGDEPLLVYSTEFQFLQNATWFRRLLGRVRIGLATNSTLTLLAAARTGLGVAVLPEFVARHDRQLVRVTRREVSRHEAWLVTHPDFRRDPRVRAVVDFIKSIGPALTDEGA